MRRWRPPRIHAHCGLFSTSLLSGLGWIAGSVARRAAFPRAFIIGALMLVMMPPRPSSPDSLLLGDTHPLPFQLPLRSIPSHPLLITAIPFHFLSCRRHLPPFIIISLPFYLSSSPATVPFFVTSSFPASRRGLLLSRHCVFCSFQASNVNPGHP